MQVFTPARTPAGFRPDPIASRMTLGTSRYLLSPFIPHLSFLTVFLAVTEGLGSPDLIANAVTAFALGALRRCPFASFSPDDPAPSALLDSKISVVVLEKKLAILK